jgi:hypothetical protein
MFPQPLEDLTLKLGVRLRNPNWETAFEPITDHNIPTATGMRGTVSCQ